MNDNRTIRRLKQQVDELRAKLHAAHDLLHNDRLNELHDLLHCSSCDEAADALTPLPGQNIAVGAAARLAEFIPEFNRLCAAKKINAAAVAMLDSATKKGYVSVQFGGSVEVINWLRSQMGMAPTLAVGDHAH